ncbi:MAG: hypothetical protein Q4B43_11035, partial [Bacteroidota bacterium]|nr:hypothetical protein [Bacteroidota bacterium]
GQKFGQALVQGAIHGLIGATIGGITGGLVGGISAAIDHRNFWDGSKVINTEVLADANLPATIQEGPFDCGYANAQANTGISQVEYKNKAIELMKQYPKLYSEKGVKPKLLKLAIEDLTGKQVMISNDKFPTSIAEIQSYKMWLNQGNRFIFSSGTETSINHATSLNKIIVRSVQKLSGSVYHKLFYQIMNTDGGYFKTIPAKAMNFDLFLRIFP